MPNHEDQCSAVRDEESSIVGAQGAFKVKQRGDVRLPIDTSAGLRTYREKDGILNKACPYFLLAGGRASREQGVVAHLPAWGEEGYFEFPSGVRVTLYNQFVYVLRPLGYKASPPKQPALASTSADLGVPPEGPYVVYLGSGIRRDGDLSECFVTVCCGAVVVCIDKKIGGSTHDYTSPLIAECLHAAVVSHRCLGCQISTQCRTFSAAQFLPDALGRPGRPARRAGHVTGVTREDGTLPLQVIEGNAEAEVASRIATAAFDAGKNVIVEAPVLRDPSRVAMQKHALSDAVGHVYVFDHPAWVAFIAKSGSLMAYSDQCEDAPEPAKAPIKATAWLATPGIFPAVDDEFTPMAP